MKKTLYSGTSHGISTPALKAVAANIPANNSTNP